MPRRPRLRASSRPWARSDLACCRSSLVRAGLAGPWCRAHGPFDKLRANGVSTQATHPRAPLGLSLSKPCRLAHKPFDRLRANGCEYTSNASTRPVRTAPPAAVKARPHVRGPFENKTLAACLVIPAVSVMVFAMLIPLGFSIYYSLTDWSGFGVYRFNRAGELPRDPDGRRGLLARPLEHAAADAGDDPGPEPDRLCAGRGAGARVQAALQAAAHDLLRARRAVRWSSSPGCGSTSSTRPTAC